VGGRLAVQPAAAGPAALAARLDDLLRSPAVPPGRPLTAGESGIMAARRRRRRRIREALARVAIFAGVVGVWYAVAGVRDSVITRTLPLELRGARDLPGFAPPRPNEVTLELRGPRRLITAASPADLHAWIDVAAARPGANELPVRAAAPPGIDVVRVFPPRVILEVLERRRLPVAVDARGGLAVKSVSPEAVDVVGRAEAFQGVDAVRTRPVGPGAVEGGEARTEVVLKPGLELLDEGQREVVVGVE